MIEYRLDVYDTSGILQYILTDFTELSYNKRVNAPGFLKMDIAGDHDLWTNIADKWEIEVWRKPEGGSWGADFWAIYREPDWRYFPRTGSEVTLHCPGILSKLGWRHILWYANTANRTKFTSAKGETIMKTLVDYNAGANATTGNGRWRAGTITGLTNETDGANGNTLNWFCFGKNLLTNLQELARVAGGDFDLIKTSPTAWQFRWYTGQRGTDRSATLTFAMGRGNMADPRFRQRRLKEKTVAAVAGKGEEDDREYVIRTGTNYSASNDIEMFVNATDIEYGDTSGLNARGDEKLDEVEARDVFEFDIVQTDTTRYGTDFEFGDKVTAINPATDASITAKITGITVKLEKSGKETISAEFETA